MTKAQEAEIAEWIIQIHDHLKAREAERLETKRAVSALADQGRYDEALRVMVNGWHDEQ